MSYYGIYQRLGVLVWAPRLTLLRAAVRALSGKRRCDPTKRAARYVFYHQCLEYRQQDQAICIEYRL